MICTTQRGGASSRSPAPLRPSEQPSGGCRLDGSPGCRGGASRDRAPSATIGSIAIAPTHRPPTGDATMSQRSALWIVSFLILVSAGAASSRAQGPGPTDAGAPAARRTPSPARPAPAVADLLRYEPTGLSLLRPYARGKVPVVFVHGLWSSPWSWQRMIGELEADPSLGDRYQFWTFGYSTGDPIPHSAVLLRRDLDEVRRKLDPEQVRSGVRPDGPRRPQHGRAAGQDDGRGDRGPHLAGGQRPAIRRALQRTRRPRPLPPRPVLRTAAGGAPGRLHRHAAPGQPARPRIAPAHRHRAWSACPIRCGRPTAGSSPAIPRPSSGSTSAKVCRPASTSWSPARRSCRA